MSGSFWCELAWLGGEHGRGGRRRSRSRASGSPPSRPGSRSAPAEATRLAGPDAAGLRQRALARLPPRPARPHARGRRQLLDLARAHVRGRRPRSTPTATSAWRARRSPRWRWPGSPRSASSTTSTTAPAAARYDDPNEMGRALIAAAARGRDPDHAARRLLPARRRRRAAQRGAAALLRRRRRRLGERVDAARRAARACGSAPRSTASAPSIPRRRPTVAAWAAGRERPLHAHVSEQPAENEACLAAYGLTPTARCSTEAGALGERFTAVHATHLDRRRHRPARSARLLLLLLPDDRARPRRRDRPRLASCWRRRGAARARLRLARRDRHARGGARGRARRAARERRARARTTPPELLRAATRAGHASHRLARGGRDRGRRPSPISSRSGSTASGSPVPTRAGRRSRRPSSRRPPPMSRASSATAATIVTRRAPRRASTSPPSCAPSIAEAPGMSALVIDDIGLLVTNDPELGEGPLGVVRDAAVVIEDGGSPPSSRPVPRRRAHRRRRALRDPRLRRQPHPPALRRRPRRGVRGADGGRAVRGRRDPR